MVDNNFRGLSQAMADAVEKAAESVVSVSARKRFPASGIAISQDLVLTASHVVEREEEILISVSTGSDLHASLVGRDMGSDLVLLKVQEAKLQPAQKAEREPRIGELVLALGRPGHQGVQASLGIIHAAGGPVRTERGAALEKYFLTDATPYPGFSGGPLDSAEGSDLGMNTSGLAPGSSIVIPAIIAWQAADSLSKHGRVRRGYLGIRSQTVELPETARNSLNRKQDSGLLIIGIEDNSPAAQSGLIVGDILVGINGKPISNHDELMLVLGADTVGQTVKAEILRGGVPNQVELTIGERT